MKTVAMTEAVYDYLSEHQTPLHPALLELVGVTLQRANGVILADNVLWSGRIVDTAVTSAATEALRRFNALVRKDSRVEPTMLSIADGLTMIRKKG